MRCADKTKKGITVVELLIAMALVAMIAAVLSPMFTAASRAWDKDKRLKEMAQKARDAMDLMTYEFKKTNAVIAIDPAYVAFSTAGEEFYLDDKNSGYTTNGVVGFTPGTQPGGFAGDYDETSAGYATYSYSFATLLPGEYDLYAYYIATSAVMRLNVFDDSTLDYNTTYDQSGARFSTTALGASWDQLNRSDPTTRESLNLTGREGAIGATKSSGSANAVADGFKFVYQGFRHKVFYFNAAGNKITYGNNVSGYTNANNPTLLSNVSQIGSTDVFTFYEADGATATADPASVALVRIQFQITDPEEKVSPLEFRGQAEIRSSGGAVSTRKIIINEVNYQPPVTNIFTDTFEPAGCSCAAGACACPMTYAGWNNWFDNFDGGVNGWANDAAWGQCTIGGTCGAPNAPVNFDTSSPTTWAISPGGNYPASTNSNLTSPNIAIPAIAADVAVRFYYLRRGGGGGPSWTGDILSVQINDDAGGNCDAAAGWQTLDNSINMGGGNDAAWTLAQMAGLTINAYKGCTVQVRFNFVSTATNHGRLYLENIVIRTTSSGNGNNLGDMVTAPAAGNLVLWAKGDTNALGLGFNCKSGTNCYGTIIDNADADNYPEYMDASFVVNDPVNLSGYDSPFLEFYIRADLEDPGFKGAEFDGAIVQVASDGDAGWPNPTVWHQLGTQEVAGAAGGTDSGCARTTDTDDFIVDYDSAVPVGSNPLSISSGYQPAGSGVCDGAAAPNDRRYAWTSDRNTSWAKVSASLSPWFTGGQIKLRIRFGSDLSGTSTGFFVDDIRVYDAPDVDYEWIELYNPNPNPVDVNNWRVRTQTSYGDAPTQYDVISVDAGNGGTSSEIGPYGYAIVTATGTQVYNGTRYTLPAEVPGARRLKIDDSRFGYNNTRTDGYNDGLTDHFGTVEILDNNGNLIDFLLYNSVFHDDMENYANWSENKWAAKWSTNNYGNVSFWKVLDPAEGAPTFANDYDHTRGQYGINGGLCWSQNSGALDERYTNRHEGALMFTLDLSATTASKPPTLEFWRRIGTPGTDDGLQLQVSTDGGGSFTQCPPFAGTIPNERLDVDYDTNVVAANCGTSVWFGGQPVYQVTVPDWSRVRVDLQNYVGQIIQFNFYFGAGNAGANQKPFYIDDVAVYYNWGGNGTGTLERKYWKGDSTTAANWAQSANATAPNIGTPNAANTQTP